MVTVNDLKTPDESTKRVKKILNTSGFFLKPWVWSDQSGRQEHVPQELGISSNGVIILPNQIQEENNKVLEVGYPVAPNYPHQLLKKGEENEWVKISLKKKKLLTR